MIQISINETKKREYTGEKDSLGRKHGFGVESDNNDYLYIGIFSHDMKEGLGILYNDRNESFKGYFKNDKKNGFGKLKNENTEFYGYWKDDIQIDLGFEIWIDSSNYFGEYIWNPQVKLLIFE